MKFCHRRSTKNVKAKLLLWTEGHFLCLSSIDWKSSNLKPDWKDVYLWFRVDLPCYYQWNWCRCLWKILETFGGKKKAIMNLWDLMLYRGLQHLSWSVLLLSNVGESCQKIPVWSLLFLDCTLYRRIIWQEESCYFCFSLEAVTSMSKLRKMSF